MSNAECTSTSTLYDNPCTAYSWFSRLNFIISLDYEIDDIPIVLYICYRSFHNHFNKTPQNTRLSFGFLNITNTRMFIPDAVFQEILKILLTKMHCEMLSCISYSVIAGIYHDYVIQYPQNIHMKVTSTPNSTDLLAKGGRTHLILAARHYFKVDFWSYNTILSTT